jgi:hypothetical protein
MPTYLRKSTKSYVSNLSGRNYARWRHDLVMTRVFVIVFVLVFIFVSPINSCRAAVHVRRRHDSKNLNYLIFCRRAIRRRGAIDAPPIKFINSAHVIWKWQPPPIAGWPRSHDYCDEPKIPSHTPWNKVDYIIALKKSAWPF